MCNCYRAGDGHWFWLLGVEADRMWPKLCAALDRPDLADDERFSTARGRRHHTTDLVATLDEIFAASTRDELTAAFDREDVVVGAGEHAGRGVHRSAGDRGGCVRRRARGASRARPSGGRHPGDLPR